MGRSELTILHEAANSLKLKLKSQPEIGIVLGTGLSSALTHLSHETRLSWDEIPQFPALSAPSHLGEWIAGERANKKILVQRGRAHFYEGLSMTEILRPIRVMRLLGVKTLILTSAVGAINTEFSVGDFVAIKDQINLIPESPLRGENLDEMGPRFPDMSEIYSSAMRQVALQSAAKLKIPVHEGVYVATPGPMFETPAEIEAFRGMGGDVVGMSLAPEAIAARHAGMEVLGLSCVTNMAAGVVRGGRISEQDVTSVTQSRVANLTELIDEILLIL